MVEAVCGVWQGASRSPKGTYPASRGVWNALRTYLNVRPAAINAGAFPVEQYQPIPFCEARSQYGQRGSRGKNTKI